MNDRAIAALRTLADELERMPEDSGITAAINTTLSNIPGGSDTQRIMWLLLQPEVVTWDEDASSIEADPMAAQRRGA